MELHQKVLVSEDFPDSTHGSLGCVECHGGNNSSVEMAIAHKGMIADPTFPNPEPVCGQCHEEEARLAKNSLHYTLATFKPMVHQRANQNPSQIALLNKGMDNHCFSCHASCGECHVSRPNSAKGGFIAGHNFKKKPDLVNQCTACHGSRVGNEFTGETGSGDVHYVVYGMDCIACHDGQEMHGDGKTDHLNRYEVEGAAACRDCHELDDQIEQHAIHGEQVSCYVCHSQPYANCYACHVGLDSQGLAFFKNPEEEEMLRIGRNPNPSVNNPEKWVLLRRVPAVPGSFDYYGKDLLTEFDNVNNWKYASPHNIQKRTTQNSQCNNCHGNQKFFLTEDKVKPEFRRANKNVIVPLDIIPERQAEKKTTKKKKGFF